MNGHSFENEIWAQDDEQVDEMLAWAEEQKEHDLKELWLVVYVGDDSNGGEGLPLNHEDAPPYYRLN